MSLEELGSLDASEGWSNSAEVSEKFKESVKRASAGIKRTQKDEKKAKKYDFLLAKFLVKIILEKKYDVLLDGLFDCLHKWYATNFLMGVFSLVYLPISDEIRKESKKQSIVFSYLPRAEKQEFHDSFIDDELRLRINQWIEDMEDVISLEPSSVTSLKTIKLLEKDEFIYSFTAQVFAFFLQEKNIHIPHSKAKSYSEFIILELEKTLKKITFETI